MNIGIVGLGLIGGSMAKAIGEYTDHTVWGADLSSQVLSGAEEQKVIVGELTSEQIPQCQLILLALYPQDAVGWVRENQRYFHKETVVMDLCGVKKVVCDPLFPLAREGGFYFIGGHPMAGIEFSGFSHSTASLFQNAAMVLTPPENFPERILEEIQQFCKTLGFSKIEVTTPEHHDEMIAFTSQLAHVVSSAYIKSPAALFQKGYSAGSYKDMTRVARLNETMWTELFLENAEPLLREIDGLIFHLKEYRDAIAGKNSKTLFQLLKEGRESKAKADGVNASME